MTCKFPECKCNCENNGRHECRKSDFCRSCGACIPPKPGEGTCQKCDPEGCDENARRAPKAPQMARGAFCEGGLGWGSCLCLKTALWTFSEGCLYKETDGCPGCGRKSALVDCPCFYGL